MSPYERKNEIKELLLTPGRKWRRAELAKRLGVNRSTIGRNIEKFRDELSITEEEGFLYIDPHLYMSKIPMNIHEMLALHLATRLLVRKSNIASKHFISLLEKLEGSFNIRSPRIAKIVADTKSGFIGKQNEPGVNRKTQILEDLNKGWLEQKVVRITYKSPTSEFSKVYFCSIYYLEPYADGLSLHVIALDRDKKIIRDFKFERIEKVLLTTEGYKIPEDFCASIYFKDAWGIWVEDGDPLLVKLHFDCKTAKRVLENKWHPSQEIKKEEDGSLTWTCRVKQAQEMVPWIRSWGSGAEVLEPLELRTLIAEEVARMGEIYN